jgi:hypothetical protein
MAAKKKKKAKKTSGGRKAKKAQKTKGARKTKKTAKRPAKKSSRKASKKTATAKKAPARKASSSGKKSAPKKKSQTKGEGDYAASRAFLKDQAGFVEKNKGKIPAMGREAADALEGPQGDALRAAEADAADRSRDMPA